MTTLLQYFIFEAEFIGLCKRLTRYLEDRGYSVGLNVGGNNKGYNYLNTIETIFHHRYMDDPFIVNKTPNEKYDFGEIFEMEEKKHYRSTTILEWEFVDGGNKLHKAKGPTFEIRLEVEQKINNLDYSIRLVLDSDKGSQIIELSFTEWRTVLTTIVSHIKGKFE